MWDESSRVWDESRGMWVRRPAVAADTAQYYVGLDLGQSADYTAAAIVRAAPGEHAPQCEVIGLRRFALGTPYAQIVESVSDLLRRPPLDRRSTKLLVDATGVGMPVVEMFRKAGMRPIAVVMTAGAAPNQVDAYRWNVPKRDLASALQILLQSGRLKISASLSEAATLQRELLSFRVRVTPAANDTYAAWREGDHDDTVLAVAMVAWAVEALRKRKLRVW